MHPIRPLFLLTLCLGAVLRAEDPAAARGLEIAREVKRRDTGYRDFVVQARMTLGNAQGQSSVRELEIRTMEVEGQGERSLIRFTAPADTAGTLLLSHSHRDRQDDQWLYLPSLRRTRRIASGNKSGSFVGSEFSYEDISPQQVEKYTYLYLREDEKFGQRCHVVERRAIDPRSSGYSKEVIWVDMAEYRPLFAEDYDRRGDLLKTLALENYQRYLDQYWRPGRMVMTNVQSGKTTTIDFSDYQFRAGLGESIFDPTRLERQ